MRPKTEPNERSDRRPGNRIELEGIEAAFDDVVAVDGVDLVVDPGELLVLLGPSGCGKTTTLRTIAGLEVPTAGTIRIGGQNVTETLPQDRDVALVFQNYALYPHKTVEGNLRFPLAKMDLSSAERDRRVAWVAELLDIEDILDSTPDALSGGQRQRVALGRGIVREPSAFLLDEPLSNLDAERRVETRAELKSLQRRLGTTTIYVTHDQEEALSIADRIAIMREGAIEQIGTPQEVYRKPSTRFVGAFLGEPTMNFVDPSIPDSMGSELARSLDLDRRVHEIGIRPEDIYLGSNVPEDGTLGPPYEMTVETIDPLGHGYEMTASDGTTRLDILTDRASATVGDNIELRVDVASIHTFGSDGRTLRQEDSV